MANKIFFKYLDYNKTERLRFRIVTVKGKVSDVLIQYETLLNGKWVPIVRYDCSHGFFHRDQLNPDGTQNKFAVNINDLELGLLYAEQELKDKWDYYKQQYIRKLKNDK